MKRVSFQISIGASVERVWEVLWGDDYYQRWFSVFMEGSYAETDWNEGSKVLFLTPEGEGMVSTIKIKKPYKHMVFQHLGTVSKGEEDLDNEWAGAIESYTLESNGGTKLTVEVDTIEKYREYFEKVWPVAMERIKELAEKEVVE
ncbi:SRPBCC domain-containing protein [Fulvivirga sp. 29W222]|uniref:SRPBCC domain-containing protein n=1 Tax=Fulvivirga marina TaxID=2494733 RepID=A0A937FTC2_9BACT|nr:SRPBCC domain-containing protein [Fulvivirga marina]MBL6445435.1 SRPBCC domain-containing protein [Fulvivirga marina]